jgi:hypothetical protein
MHEIKPFYLWQEDYNASFDKLSPFYRRRYHSFQYTQKIYNYFIHPQWDYFGSSTLYCKVLFADYQHHFAIIELMGEWNDLLYNDIMELKRSLIDSMISHGIFKYLLIGENILNFHASDDLYYQEWHEEVAEKDGWIAALNFREHVVDEMRSRCIHHYIEMGQHLEIIDWRKHKPHHIIRMVENAMLKSIGS